MTSGVARGERRRGGARARLRAAAPRRRRRAALQAQRPSHPRRRGRPRRGLQPGLARALHAARRRRRGGEPRRLPRDGRATAARSTSCAAAPDRVAPTASRRNGRGPSSSTSPAGSTTPPACAPGRGHARAPRRARAAAAALCLIHGYSRPEAARGARRQRPPDGEDHGRRHAQVALLTGDIADDWCRSRESLISAYALGLLEQGGERHAAAAAHLRQCSCLPALGQPATRAGRRPAADRASAPAGRDAGEGRRSGRRGRGRRRRPAPSPRAAEPVRRGRRRRRPRGRRDVGRRAAAVALVVLGASGALHGERAPPAGAAAGRRAAAGPGPPRASSGATAATPPPNDPPRRQASPPAPHDDHVRRGSRAAADGARTGPGDADRRLHPTGREGRPQARGRHRRRAGVRPRALTRAGARAARTPRAKLAGGNEAVARDRHTSPPRRSRPPPWSPSGGGRGAPPPAHPRMHGPANATHPSASPDVRA